MIIDKEIISSFYKSLPEAVNDVGNRLHRPLALEEKILYAHLADKNLLVQHSRGGDYAEFIPDRVAMQDATAQMALGQFMVTGKERTAIPSVARAYKSAGLSSFVVGDENFGEGSSREHAALEPRFLGVKMIIVKSFARIHETNLKKQGILALTFADSNDYERIREDDRFEVPGLENFAEGSSILLRINHSDGSSDYIETKHSYNTKQISWFKAGSALNLIRKSNE